MLFGVSFEQLSGGPFDREEMHSRCGLADLDRLNDIWMFHTLAIACFTHESRDGGLVLAKLFAKDFYGNDAMDGMLGAKDSGCSALSHLTAQRIPCKRSTYQALFWHVANLTSSSMP